ncbi:ankyrin repeat-containing domain protein [Mycena crocata]|nr:ankyrin repeat-containing domain protein [Mycena crocata]
MFDRLRGSLKRVFSGKRSNSRSRDVSNNTSSVPMGAGNPATSEPRVVGATSAASPLLAAAPATSQAPIVGGGSAAQSSAAISPQTLPTSANDLRSGVGSGLAIDNIALTLGLVEKVAALFQTVPFIAPVAALMSEILKAYKEVKDTNDKRESLFIRITDISHDLCATVLRMEATNHLDLVGRLKSDIDKYAKLLEKASNVVKEYSDRGVVVRVAARTQLSNELGVLERELDSFGARFRTNRLVDLAINQNVVAGTINQIYDMVTIEKIEKWLGPPPDMLKKQHETQKLRQEGTGRWFLDADYFVQWQDNPGALWIQGPSGAGKSVLSSAVITKLVDDRRLFEDLGKSSASGVAFFYFDFKDKEHHTVENALRRIVLQLSAHSPNHYRVLDKHYTLSKGQTLPTYKDLQEILEELLLELGRTYIVIDALDECQDTEYDNLANFVSILRGWTRSPLHLLIASQPRTIFIHRFEAIPWIFLESKLTEKDIKLFVDSELRGNHKLKKWLPRADEVADRVVRKSNGMFRLAACILVELSRCRWQDELKETLENLPDDLFGIYDRFLQRIRQKDLVYVTGVLRWLLFSARPVTPSEIVDAIAFDFSDPERYTYLPDRRYGIVILNDCLQKIAPGTSSEAERAYLTVAMAIWPWWFQERPAFSRVCDEDKPELMLKLAHSSVQDYILSNHFEQNSGFDLSADLSNTFLARSCIRYLLHFADHPLDRTTFPNYPLAMYAAEHWCYHLLRCHDQTVLFADAMHLLQEGSKQFLTLSRLRTLQHTLINDIDWSSENPPALAPLHLCWHERYTAGMQGLLENGSDAGIPYEGMPLLHWASIQGRTDEAALLLANGADANLYIPSHIPDGLSDLPASMEEVTALQWASLKGHSKIVSLLLANGAEVDNVYFSTWGTGLQLASYQGHVDTVSVLLARGASVDGKGALYVESTRPLQAASAKNHIEIVRLLLAYGADVNDGEAFTAACFAGHTQIVNLFIASGADVNAPNSHDSEVGIYGSALRAASLNGQTEIARILLENGADINASHGGTALQAASLNGHAETVFFLLESGADVNAQAEYYGVYRTSESTSSRGGALHAASRSGSTNIVCFLLENGANVNGTPEDSGCPLYVAVVNGYTDIVRILLQNGADVDTTGALQAACYRGREEIVQILLERGANVNAHGRYFDQTFSVSRQGGVLHSAVWSRSKRNRPSAVKTVRLLLEMGAEVDGHPEDDGGPLHAACLCGYTNIVQIFLEHGANVDATGTRYGTPLQAASVEGRTEVVKILLENGANINSHGEYQDKRNRKFAGSSLLGACQKGHTETARLLLANVAALRGRTSMVFLLLENGADVHAHNGKYGTSLQAASERGHTEVVRALLEHGADIDTDREHRTSNRYKHSVTALLAASSHGYHEIVHLLLQKGANVNVQSEYCDINWPYRFAHRGDALHAACNGGNGKNEGHTKAVRLLIPYSDLRSHGGGALKAASSRGHADIVDLLLKEGATWDTETGEDLKVSYHYEDPSDRSEVESVERALPGADAEWGSLFELDLNHSNCLGLVF